jgi:hypothetical protein
LIKLIVRENERERERERDEPSEANRKSAEDKEAKQLVAGRRVLQREAADSRETSGKRRLTSCVAQVERERERELKADKVKE